MGSDHGGQRQRPGWDEYRGIAKRRSYITESDSAEALTVKRVVSQLGIIGQPIVGSAPDLC